MNLTLAKSSFSGRTHAARVAKAKEKLHADTPRMASTRLLRSLTGLSVFATVFTLSLIHI